MLALLAGCGQRERLTFPTENPGNGVGPLTRIISPSADTTVFDGDPVFIDGRSIDPDGVDRIYIDVEGLGQSFGPQNGEGRDTVDFSLRLSTINLHGQTGTVRIWAVDRLGDEGSPVSRRITVR